MNINSSLGQVFLEIYIDSFSSVDSYIESGYYVDTERELTEDELYILQDELAGEIQSYAYENGSRNHN